MNKMKEVAALFGLKLGERFKISGRKEVFFFSKTGLIHKNECGDFKNPAVLAELLSGECEIEYLPWKPKDDEYYWYVGLNGTVSRDVFEHDGMIDLIFYKVGNCFKTEMQAKANADRIAKMYANIRKELGA